MKLIIGGAYQGKLAYARSVYGCTDGWVDGRICALQAIGQCAGIYNFHEYIRRLLQQTDENYGWKIDQLTDIEEQAKQFTDEILKKNPELLIVSNELGYGIVPVEKSDRIWREAVGRVCTCLAAHAEEVTRVVCGIGIRIR